MQGVHELADLAPRDVVAKAITRRMHETGHPHMWLDARHLGAAFWERRFPTILRDLPRARRRPGHRADPGRPGLPLRLRRGRHRPVGPLRRPGPVRHRRGRLLRRARRQPAGLQLAARGAGLLPAHRRRAARRAPALGRPGRRRARTAGLVPGDLRRELQELMTDRVGVLRSADGLAERRRRARRAGAASTDPVDQDGLGDDQPADRQHRAGRGGRAARGDPRLALARGLPRARRRPVRRALRRLMSDGGLASRSSPPRRPTRRCPASEP